MSDQTITRREATPGGWRTVRRVLLPASPIAVIPSCPNCKNSDPGRFETIVSGTCLKGFACLNCELESKP